MNNKLAGLADLLGTDRIVRLENKVGPSDRHSSLGFLVGLSERLLLLHILEGDTLQLNGYVAVRLKDVASFRVDDTWISHSLRLSDMFPVVPQSIELSDWPALLSSLLDTYPLVMLETQKEPENAFVGSVVQLTKQYVLLRHVNRQGKWAESEKFFFKDITRVNFGDGYVRALAQFVAHQTHNLVQ